MKHFLGSVGVRGSVRGPFFTRHPPTINKCYYFMLCCYILRQALFPTPVNTKQVVDTDGYNISSHGCSP